MNRICINKVCFEFSIYHFIYLVILIIIGNYLLDIFRSSKFKLMENLFNINYDIPDYNTYPGQFLTRSTQQTKTSDEYDGLTNDYDKFDFTKPRIKSTNDSSNNPIPSVNYSAPTNIINLPNNGMTDYDLIKQRDLGVISNPLIAPERRTERPTIDMTLPLLKNKYIGLPTRGSYDTYQNSGYLVDSTNADNVLKLFGRQKWPGSTQYEYYAIKTTAVDQFKVPLNHIKKQLFDGDPVTLSKIFPGSYKYMEFKQEELI